MVKFVICYSEELQMAWRTLLVITAVNLTLKCCSYKLSNKI